MSASIEAIDLVRRFGDTEAVAGVSLAIAPGEIYGFLGPNGAGKSTTVRVLTTLLAPTSGDAIVAGHSVRTAPEQVRLRNEIMRADLERGARRDAVAAGELVDAQAVSRALHRQLGPLIGIFDELPAAIAKPIAEQFGLDYAVVLIAVKNAVRRQRMAWAESAAAVGRHAVAQVAA